MPQPDWMSRFAGLETLDPEAARRFGDLGRIIRARAGSHVFHPGETPQNYLLVTSGTVRVQMASEGGREIVLYRVTAGEGCVLTTACLIGHEEYRAEGIAETDVEAVALPGREFDALVAASPSFRKFVFTGFSARLTSLLRLIDEVAFARIDIRLAAKLLERANGTAIVVATQQQLASELGSAREVVGRQLHEFQRQGAIALSRGTIEIVRRERLEGLARG